MPPIRAICFDLDGTLYDLPKMKRRLWASMLRHPRVLSAWQKETEAVRGQRHSDIHGWVAKQVASKVGIETSKAAAIIQKVIFETYPSKFEPKHLLPGLQELFEELDQRNILRAVVSDHPVEKKLAGLAQSAGWACRIDCSALGAMKPLPDGLFKAADTMGLNVKELVLIGDRENTDGEMASAAGIPALIRHRDWHSAADLQTSLLQMIAQQ